MQTAGVDTLLLSVGADLPYLTGYEAMPLERLTMLVVPVDGPAELVVPALEAPRVTPHDDVFSLVGWGETDDPIGLVVDRIGSARSVAIGETTWATFLVDLVKRCPAVTFTNAGEVMTALRSVKQPAEVESLRRAGAAVDRIAARLQAGEIDVIGRTEAQVSAELARQIIAEGHQRVNFAIVAAGANAASPHHEAGDRIIEPNEVVLCDFGGTMLDDHGVGYCSDITRCVYTGEPPAEFAELYEVLFEAQAVSVASATIGTPAQDVDRAAREVIVASGLGDYFIHRTG
ncbi:MAG: Xaa-Pro peptidase family protein, partial [Acidimicrobiales bacterium]